MTRAQKTILGVLSAIACSLLLVVFYTASQAYQTWSQQPLGPTLAYPTEWELPATWTAWSVTLQPTMTVLGIGTDVRPGEHRYGLADVIRAVRVDFRQQRVTALEFPRDLWVKIPGIEHNLKTDHQKLNTAYT